VISFCSAGLSAITLVELAWRQTWANAASVGAKQRQVWDSATAPASGWSSRNRLQQDGELGLTALMVWTRSPLATTRRGRRCPRGAVGPPPEVVCAAAGWRGQGRRERAAGRVAISRPMDAHTGPCQLQANSSGAKRIAAQSVRGEATTLSFHGFRVHGFREQHFEARPSGRPWKALSLSF